MSETKIKLDLVLSELHDLKEGMAEVLGAIEQYENSRHEIWGLKQTVEKLNKVIRKQTREANK